jgi:hypothetical protein
MKIASPADPSVREIVQKYLGGLAASVRTSVSEWLDASATSGMASAPAKATSSKSKPAAVRPNIHELAAALPNTLRSLFAVDALLENLNQGRLDIPAGTFDGTDLPRLAVVQPLTPIHDLEELVRGSVPTGLTTRNESRRLC